MASAKTRNGNVSEDLRPPTPHNHTSSRQLTYKRKPIVILNLFQDLWAEKDKKRLAVRCWNLRLSESRGKLAWTMPSVSKLNKVKQVQHDNWSHLFFILPFWGNQFNTYVWFFVLLWLLANSFSLPCLARLLSVPFLPSADLPILPIEGKIKRRSLTTLQRYSFI